MVKYTIAMTIRVLCIFAMLFARGWWLVVFATGAIVLPYIAVVLANVKSNPRRRAVLRPGTLVLRRHDDTPGPAPEKEPGAPE